MALRPQSAAVAGSRAAFLTAATIAAAALRVPGAAAAAVPAAQPPPPPSNLTVPPSVLFASLDDALDVSGLLRPRGSTLAAVPGGLVSPNNNSVTLFAGIFPNATFEIITLELAGAGHPRGPADSDAHKSTSVPTQAAAARVVRRYLSRDLRKYDPPTELAIVGLRAAAVAKDNATGAYLLLAFVPPAGGGNGSDVKAFASRDGVAWRATGGRYSADPGCDHAGLIRHPKLGWLSFQRSLQDLKSPKPFPDSVGANRRRVVTVLRSDDNGVSWSPASAAADGAGAQPLTPGPDDPPEMELGVGGLGFVPFWYPIGGSKLAAVATNYVPSPSLVNPAAAAAAAHHVNGTTSLLPPADGPVSAQEWWVATEQGATTATGTPSSWLRPFTAQTQLSGNAGVAGQAAAPPGFSVTHAPLMVAQTVMPTKGWPSDGMFWLWRGQWLGLMNWRVGGLYSPGNAVFTSRVFTVPTSYLWLDLDSRWGAASVAQCDPAHLERCQAYVMVELLPPTGNTPIPGYEKENCNMRTVHASEQGMPLKWKPAPPPPPPSPSSNDPTSRGVYAAASPPPPLAGQRVRARIYLRDATVYAIGGGNTWASRAA